MLSHTSLLGLDEKHLSVLSNQQKLHTGACEAYFALQAEARKAGFDLQIASAFRSFDRQRGIWNAKASGNRAILDDQGRALDLSRLGDFDIVLAILRWSALPGASRHHWGTDFDVFDASVLADGASFELTLAETEPGGIFFDMHCWLDEYLATSDVFCRPYATDLGGVAREPWHLSYIPIAELCAERITPELLISVLERESIVLKTTVLEHFDEIYSRFVTNVTLPGR